MIDLGVYSDKYVKLEPWINRNPAYINRSCLCPFMFGFDFHPLTSETDPRRDFEKEGSRKKGVSGF